MSATVLSIGKAGKWTITIEESGPDGTLVIWLHSPTAYLQFNIHDLVTLRSVGQFLCSCEENDQWFELENCLGGVLAFVIHDGALSIRLTTSDTQMFKIRLDACEAKLIGQAIDDALADVE